MRSGVKKMAPDAHRSATARSLDKHQQQLLHFL
jgi:hypothetical protein